VNFLYFVVDPPSGTSSSRAHDVVNDDAASAVQFPLAPALAPPRKRTNKDEKPQQVHMDAGAEGGGKKRVLPKKYVVKIGENGANIVERFLMYGLPVTSAEPASSQTS
jgi:hypothetical protein